MSEAPKTYAPHLIKINGEWRVFGACTLMADPHPKIAEKLFQAYLWAARQNYKRWCK